MAATLLATAVPIPIVSSGLELLSDAYNSLGTSGAQVQHTYAGGDTDTVPSKLNANVLAQELIGRYGGGVYAIGRGLSLSTAGSLSLPISAGQAVIDGIVELSADTVLVVSASMARIHIWLKRDKTLTSVNNSLTPPVGACVYLGSCVTSGSAVTAVDTSGVMYYKGGMAWRQTADVAAPLDSPPSDICFFTKTLGGTYFWNGSAYSMVGAYNQVRMSLVTGLAITAAATNYIPAGGTLGLNSTEDPIEFTITQNCTLANLRVYLSANTIASGTAQLVVRKNGADTTLLVSFTSGTSVGLVADTTHSVSLAAGDTLSIKAVGATTGTPTIKTLAFDEVS